MHKTRPGFLYADQGELEFLREMRDVVRHDRGCSSSDRSRHHVHVAHIGQRNALQSCRSGSKFAPGNAVSIADRARARMSTGSPSFSRRFLIHSSWMVLDHAGLNAPASAIHSRKSRTPFLNSTQASRTADSIATFSAWDLAPELLGLGGQRFERAPARKLIAPISDYCFHRNAVMRADHATG